MFRNLFRLVYRADTYFPKHFELRVRRLDGREITKLRNERFGIRNFV